jgi:Zn-dependent peptidase ImmA (M78 family)
MFVRGFKTWCEEFSIQIRREMRLSSVSPLDPLDLAKVLDVDLREPYQLDGLPADVSERLINKHAGSWSAVSVSHGDKRLIVHNPTHSRPRRNSNLMHEMAHILLEHEPTHVFISPQAGYALRTHDENQESEAAWLAGCLLLPRPALLYIRKRGLDDDAACGEYGVSEDLLRFRMNATGVNVQLKRTRVGQNRSRR